ncbi:hypothetical protein TKK_0002619 [Trichogramma kaykai]|uniref:EH domain-containing protein n=1 Tax=Trichogramma kaykai TaxID=54128 RepID=A0ABD2WXX3_9HYME
MNKIHENSDNGVIQLPGWLNLNSNILPPIYKKIWETVRENQLEIGHLHRDAFVDTNKIFPLLLTSQLSTEILGYIWSLANQKHAGQLTEQELYIVLALVALAQSSYSFNSLDVLNHIKIPPTPHLNLSIFNSNNVIGKNEMKSPSLGENPSTVDTYNIDKNHDSSSKYYSTQSSNSTNNFGALVFNHGNENLKDRKISTNYPCYETDSKHSTSCSADLNDDFSDFQSAPITTTSSSLWETKQGSAIGSRLANHNLGVKKITDKSKKVYSNKNYNNQSYANTSSLNNFALHSKELQPNEYLLELFPKCTVKNQAKTIILKDTAIRNVDSVGKIKSPVKDFSNTLDEIVSSKANLKESNDGIIQQDLMSLKSSEDKYSALRALVKETPAPVDIKSEEEVFNVNSVSDDFGDFVSANHPKPAKKSEISDTKHPFDLLGNLDLNAESISDSNSKSSHLITQDNSADFNDFSLKENTIVDSEDKFDIIDTEKVVSQEGGSLVKNVELALPPSNSLTRSGSVLSLNLKSFSSTSQQDEQKFENIHQIIYWEWKQYMESCILLLQLAANIFTNISSDVVLNEVLSSAKGYNFLVNLAEVAAVCRRINFSYKEIDVNIMEFDDLLINIDKIWSEMEPYYANIPIVTELPAWPVQCAEGSSCALCLTMITSNRIIYNNISYHSTCANLWLHAVNNNLPALQYPLT